jgi:hypothetical protein
MGGRTEEDIMGRRISPAPLVVAFGLAGLAAAGAAVAQGQGQQNWQARCPDYGSFGVVDAPPPPRGAPIVARSIQPCAELPGSPQQPPLYIDAQVQVGGQTGTGTTTSGSGTAAGGSGSVSVQMPQLQGPVQGPAGGWATGGPILRRR